MDVFSHGFWGGLFFGKNRRLLFWAVLFGVLPDVIAFSPLLFYAYNGHFVLGSQPDMSMYPQTILTLYSITHSLVIAIPIYFFIRFFNRELSYAFLAWPLHILFDIPTHTADYFPTPFLYPISNFHISGISWSQPYFFIANYTAIVAISIFLIAKKHRNINLKNVKKWLLFSSQKTRD